MYPPERFSAELGGPLPREFQLTEELVINNDLHRAVKDDSLDIAKIRDLLNTAGRWQIKLDAEGIGYELKLNLEKMMSAFAVIPADIEKLRELLAAVTLAHGLPFPVDLWKVQNIFWNIMNNVYPQFKTNKEWVENFTALGKLLNIRVVE
jgi:hypothetical protein